MIKKQDFVKISPENFFDFFILLEILILQVFVFPLAKFSVVVNQINYTQESAFLVTLHLSF